MIELRLSLAETRWLLGRLELSPSGDSPLKEPMAGVAEVPAGSTAEKGVMDSLASRGLLLQGNAANPFCASALKWLAAPEEVWSLSLFGRGGASMVHLAFREGAAVECRRDAAGVTLRFPLSEKEARAWLGSHLGGGSRGA